MSVSNRVLLPALAAVLIWTGDSAPAWAQGQAGAVTKAVAAAAGASTADTATLPARKYALSLVGEPKFGPDLKHFDWVNPDAPKGGTVRQWALGTYDSLNRFSVKGNSAVSLGLIYDTLMVDSADEPSTEYGFIAEWVSHPADFSSVTFGLRQEARFHDGMAITPEDIIFSLAALKKAHPFYALYYKNVVKAEKTGPREVTFRFNVTGNRELPQIVGQLPALPKHYWTAKGANGEPRDLSKSTLEIPLGSGPYKIARSEPGRFIVYERVKDWWAKDLAVTRGQYNFDKLRFTYFRDRTPAFEAFKSGELDFWNERTSRSWATAYSFPAVKKGWIKKRPVALKTPVPMQAFAVNLRRKRFADPRVRRALNLAFDFEWANKNLFYDQYTRVGSYFGNTGLSSSGLPKGRELELLRELRDLVPPEVFTSVYENPVNRSPEDSRANMAKAQKLLIAAGWKLQTIKVEDPQCGFFCKAMMSIGLRQAKTDRVLRNEAGEMFNAEFLLVQRGFERIVLPFVRNLELLGIKARVRVVDAAQYQRRTDEFDFDIIVASFRQSHSPGNEQREFWGSAAAGKNGSRNLIGIKNEAVDKLVDKIIFAKDRSELVAATRALDRVLLWNHYVVPQWHSPLERLAMWDIFGRPSKLPSQSVAFERVYWWDQAAAAKLKKARNK